MAAGSTYTPIQTYTANGSQSSITFSSIPSTYTDLVVVINAAGASSGFGSQIRFNSDSSTNYSQTILYGDGASAASVRSSSVNTVNLNYYGDATTTALAQTIIVQVQNYSNTTTYKTFMSRGGNAASGLSAGVYLWRSTAAINSINIFSVGGANYSSNTTMTLYGITAA
jgi:hypothetical protein